MRVQLVDDGIHQQPDQQTAGHVNHECAERESPAAWGSASEIVCRAALVFGDKLTSLTRSLRVSNARLRAATGWAPRNPSAREG